MSLCNFTNVTLIIRRLLLNGPCCHEVTIFVLKELSGVRVLRREQGVSGMNEGAEWNNDQVE